MSQQVLTNQAALIYAEPPVFDAADLLGALNSALVSMGHVPLKPGPMMSEQFMLFSQPRLHATIAIHRTPLGTHGLERALNAARLGRAACDYQPILKKNRAHVVITVAAGETPLPFDPPEPVEARTLLEILFRLIRFVTAEARPVAAHLCTSDRLYKPEELDRALTRNLPASLLVHPTEVRVDQRAGGQTGVSLIAHQSAHLLGKTLIIEGLPLSVPKKLGEQLVESLIARHLEGKLPLANGDRVRKNDDITLHVRHEDSVSVSPDGAIVVSFWDQAPKANYLDRQSPFEGHRGYNALPPKSPMPEDMAEASDSSNWDSGYISGAALSSSPRKSGPPTWMIMVAIGMFLWIGLPLLDIPKSVIESTFSNGLNAEPLN